MERTKFQYHYRVDGIGYVWFEEACDACGGKESVERRMTLVLDMFKQGKRDRGVKNGFSVQFGDGLTITVTEVEINDPYTEARKAIDMIAEHIFGVPHGEFGIADWDSQAMALSCLDALSKFVNDMENGGK